MITPHEHTLVARSPRPPAVKPRVLLVDDDEHLLFLLKRTLTQVGYRVDTAADAEAGWKAINAAGYDLLITDYNMPGMDGLRLIGKLRHHLFMLPCILFSSLLPGTEADLAARVHPGAALEKTYPFSELLAEVATQLSQPRCLVAV